MGGIVDMAERIDSMRDEKRIHGQGVPAYMTVEASLIMPMVLCVLVICIYTAFLLYDCCVLYQEAYLVCLRESYRKDAGSPSVNTGRIEDDASELIGSRVFAVSTLNGAASSDGLWAVYEGTAEVAPAVFGSFYLMPKSIWNISFSARSRKTDPSWSIRSWRRKSYIVKAGLKTLTGYLTEQTSEQSTALVTAQ